MKRASVVLSVLAAACGPKSSGSTAPPPEERGGDGPVYAAIFEDGRRWTFAVESKDSYWDDQHPDADADGMVNTTETSEASCRVASTGEYQGARLASVECTGLGDGSSDPVAGLWIADAVGLYHVAATMPAPGAAPDRTYQTFILPVVPVEKEDTEEGEEGYMREAVVRKGDAWCRESSTAMGDEDWESVCVGAGGFTEGSFGWAGGSVHEVTFRAR